LSLTIGLPQNWGVRGERRAGCARRGRINECCEQRAESIDYLFALGVPLNAEKPGTVFGLACLDEAVRRKRYGMHALRKALRSHPLMMARVDLDAGLSQQSGQSACWVNRDTVPPRFPFPRRRIVRNGSVRVTVDVLVQASTQGDVDELMAATDGQHRKRAFPRQPKHFDLESVQHAIDASRFWMGLLTVARGLDVCPAGEQKATSAFDCGRGVLGRRYLAHNPACFLNSPPILSECG
jgi:hypothetical protein